VELTGLCEVTHVLFLFSSLFAFSRATFFNGRNSVMFCSSECVHFRSVWNSFFRTLIVGKDRSNSFIYTVCGPDLSGYDTVVSSWLHSMFISPFTTLQAQSHYCCKDVLTVILRRWKIVNYCHNGSCFNSWLGWVVEIQAVGAIYGPLSSPTISFCHNSTSALCCTVCIFTYSS